MAPDAPDAQADPAAEPERSLVLADLTMGEMSRIELESGSDFFQLLRGSVSRRLIVDWLADHRDPASAPFGKPRSWPELANRRPLDKGS